MHVKIPTDKKSKILNSGDLFGVMQRVLLRERKIDRNKEHFWVIGLANNNTMLYIELISLGMVNRVPVEPMEVFSIALQKRTVKMVLVHNHPSEKGTAGKKNSPGYKFGFNGKENDNEVHNAAGTSVDFGARMIDTRVGRWLKLDPLAGKYPGISPYAFALNTPVQAKDPDGKVVIFINGQHAGSGGTAAYWGGYNTRVLKRDW